LIQGRFKRYIPLICGIQFALKLYEIQSENIIKKLFKISIWLVSSLLILLTAVFIFIQTNTFNNLALNYAVGKLNESWKPKDSRIGTGSVDGNILTGLKIDSVYIVTGRDTLLKFNSIDLKYDVWGLLHHQILLDHIIINSPKIDLVKLPDSTKQLIWNFSKLFSSPEESDTATSAFDWDVAVSKFRIENGFVRTNGNGIDTFDSKKSQNRADDIFFDPENFTMSDLNLELEGKYFTDSKKINLKSFSFNSNSGFNIKSFVLDADIQIKDANTMITGLELVTDRSEININKAVLNNFNPFDSASFENFGEKDLEADINIERINFSDLRFFLPEVDMLDSTAGLILKAKGKIRDIDISELKLTLPNSVIELKGKLQNLDEPSLIYLDVAIENMNLLAADVMRSIKIEGIPDLMPFGHISGNLIFKGTFEKFFSQYEVNTQSGNAKGYIDLDINAEIYSGKISTSNLNIGKFLNNKDLISNLNLNAEFSGKSFDLNKMYSSVNYSLRNSSISGFDIRSSSGKIYFAKKNINMDVMHSSSIGSIKLRGNVNISNMNDPVYRLKGKADHLNISAFTKNAQDKSDLNFSFNINGRGSDLKNIRGSFNFDIADSYFAGSRIPETPLDIEIENRGEYSSYTLSSDLLDLSAKGNFNIGSVSKVISSNIAAISEKFKNKLIPDSASFTNNYSPVYNLAAVDNEYFDLKYELTSKDTVVLNQVLNPFGMSFNGNISGSAENRPGRFSMTSVIDIKNIVYKDTLTELNNFYSDVSFVNNYLPVQTDNSLSSVDMKMNSRGDRIIIGNTVYDSVKVNIDMSNSVAALEISGKQDEEANAFIKGKVDLNSSYITAGLDSVILNYGNINVTNEKEWIIDYLPGEKVRFEQFGIRSKELVLNVSGDYVFNGNSDVKLEAKDVPLNEIYSVLDAADTTKIIVKKEYPVIGNISKFFVNFKGTADEPELKAEIITGNLIYNDLGEEQEIGDMRIMLDYKNESAATDISLSNGGNKGSLMIKGDIPFRNPLIDIDSSMITDLEGKSVNLKLTSKNFQLKYFLKLIPSLPDISGSMNGEILATGDASSPDLKGSVAINNGEIYFGLTGMNYKYSLNTSTEHAKLVIDKLSLSSSGDEARHFDISGNIDFSGMKINDIDLVTSGDMVFLDKDVELNELGVYGYFRAGSGTPALKIKGNLDRLSITGQLLITDATISSVPLGGAGYDNKTDNFTYITVSDSAEKFSKDTLLITEAKDFYKINPFARYKFTLAEKERTAADFLDMDINVKTQNNIYVSIDFDNITKDRLFGEITADLTLKTQDKEFQATGDVNIINNSYYRFYKDFKLKDSKISFNGAITNPLLDIQAVHEGVKNTQQFGTVASVPVNVMLTLKGELDDPKIELKLIEDGTAVSGSDAQADAITFLLFGKYKNELSTTERTAVASSLGTSIGSLYISSIVSQTVRDILPFLIDAQFKYSEGNVKDTEVEFTSELGDATIRVGGKLLKEIRNFEFVIDYPLNDFLNLDLPETLLMEFSREEENNVIFGSSETTTNTGLKIAYRIKY